MGLSAPILTGMAVVMKCVHRCSEGSREGQGGKEGWRVRVRE